MKHHYSYEDIVQALKQAGLESGDTVFVHSNVGFFGRLAGASSPDDYYQAFKKAFREVLGEAGTVIMPAFSYSFCRKQVFVVEETPGIGGVLAEAMRKDPEAVRSWDANFSVCAMGKRAVELTENCPEHSFGADSFWDRFLKADGKVCNLNFDAGSTFIHYVEKSLAVPYRYDKPFPGVLRVGEREENRLYYHFVYDMDKPSNAANFTKFDKRAKETGLAVCVNLGKGQIVRITARETYDFIREELQRNPALLVDGDQVL